jgi:predicted nucleotidyltransferase
VLSDVFKSEERILILRYVGLRASVTVQAVADGTGRSKGFVSRYLTLLVDEQLLTRNHRAFIREDSVYWRSIKRLLNLDLLRPHITLPAWAEGIGLYGSWAEGTNTTESDLDLWILVSRYDPDLEIRAAELDQEIAQYAGCEVNSLLLTPDKLRHLREHDQPFYTGLKGGYLTLHGEDLESA